MFFLALNLAHYLLLIYNMERRRVNLLRTQFGSSINGWEHLSVIDYTSNDGNLDNYIGIGTVFTVFRELISNISFDKLQLNLYGWSYKLCLDRIENYLSQVQIYIAKIVFLYIWLSFDSLWGFAEVVILRIPHWRIIHLEIKIWLIDR